MSITRKIRNSILSLIIILEIIMFFILYTKNPIPEYMRDLFPLLKNVVFLNLLIFTIAIICYICEHKGYNKNEYVFDEDVIYPSFDIDLKNNDILYLSTILKQQYPEKKEIILLIMQLINKKVIDLSSYWDGEKYQYFIEKRGTISSQITNVEKNLLYYLFRDSNKVDLITKVKEIYSPKNNDIVVIIKQARDYIEGLCPIFSNPLKLIYKSIATFLAINVLFLGMCVFFTSIPILKFNGSMDVVIKFTLLAIICIVIAFIYTIILKKFNMTYQYNNDSFLWLCKNLIFIFANLIISYLFSVPYVVQVFMVAIYFFTTLTMMIKYNEHVALSKSDIIVRNRLISLKKYFKNMDYLEDKYFGNIITYEECIIYGFLFNITIKINEEFDLLQKELCSIIEKESHLYLNLFKNDVL